MRGISKAIVTGGSPSASPVPSAGASRAALALSGGGGVIKAFSTFPLVHQNVRMDGCFWSLEDKSCPNPYVHLTGTVRCTYETIHLNAFNGVQMQHEMRFLD